MTDKEIQEQRAKEYGDASKSFGTIAKMWSAYLDAEITGQQVAVCMTLLKICRSKTAKDFHLKDSFQDGRVYLTLAEKL